MEGERGAIRIDKDRGWGERQYSTLYCSNSFPHLLPVAEEDSEESKRDKQSPIDSSGKAPIVGGTALGSGCLEKRGAHRAGASAAGGSCEKLLPVHSILNPSSHGNVLVRVELRKDIGWKWGGAVMREAETAFTVGPDFGRVIQTQPPTLGTMQCRASGVEDAVVVVIQGEVAGTAPSYVPNLNH